MKQLLFRICLGLWAMFILGLWIENKSFDALYFAGVIVFGGMFIVEIFTYLIGIDHWDKPSYNNGIISKFIFKK